MISPALAEGGELNKPEDLLKLPIIGAQDPCWLEWFAEAGVKEPDLSGHKRYEYVEQDLCANAAIAGLGVAVLDRIYFFDELQAGRLIEPFNVHCSEGRGLWLVYPPGRRNTPKIKAFRNWIVKAVADDIVRTTPPGFRFDAAASASPVA